MAQAKVALPALTVNAAGSVGNVAQAAITLPMVTASGYFGGVLSVTLGDVTVAATGSIGNVGAARVMLPLFDLVAAGTVNAVSGAAIILPALQATRSGGAALQMPALVLTAIGSATVTATYEAYAVNLNHSGDNTVDEMTRYTNYPFTQIVRYQNSYFGVAADGLYLLEGTTDHATPAPAAIPWKLKTHVTDFGSPMLKTPVSVYVGGRLGQTETFTLYAGETSGTAHVYTNPRGATAQNYRQKLGRGVKARYFAVGLQGDGAAEIDNLEFDLNTLTRRI